MTSCCVGGSPFSLGMLLEYCSYRPKCLDVQVHLGHAFSCILNTVSRLETVLFLQQYSVLPGKSE